MTYGREYLPNPEIDNQLIEAFTKTFVHRQDCYPLQLDTSRSYVTIKKPLTLELFKAHFKGIVTLGAYALNEHDMAHWLCLDADDDFQWRQLREAAKQLDYDGIFPYLERSRRGGHCWLFTTPLSGKTIRQFGKQLLSRYRLEKMELYPKQDELRTGVGSLVRLPLGIHRASGKRYSFITPEGEPLAPTIRQQIALLAKPVLVPEAFIEQALAQVQAELPPPAPAKIFNRLFPADGRNLSERIKASISVFDFVSRYVELDSLGKGFCPFHDDQHKSFGVHRERNFWSCYAGCGGGSVIDFFMKWREKHGQDASFSATITELAELLF
jgi:hypothetical protein